jgi:hypothetical protein
MSKVNHPSYYGGEDNSYEAIKIIEALGFGEGFCAGNALKYMVRAGVKNPATKAEDLKKAAWYLKRWIQGDYKQAEAYKASDEDIVERAQIFALKHHSTQMYGDLPYSYHLLKVVQVLARFGIYRGPMVAAAWLHDVIEDTDATYEEVVTCFGEPIADLVSRVSDDPTIKGRTAKKADVYKRIAGPLWGETSEFALVIKLADRIANIEACISGRNKLAGPAQAKCLSKLEMYRNEQVLLNATFRPLLKGDSWSNEMFTFLDVLFRENPTL